MPGLRIPSGDDPGDVIRGEETQLAGALETLAHPGGSLTVVLPGTHSKWVRVEEGVVTGFTTAMTGELYGLLTAHGILARTAADPVADDAAFSRDWPRDGVREGSPPRRSAPGRSCSTAYWHRSRCPTTSPVS